METIITNSPKQTKNFARKFAQNLKTRVIALSGALGAGKTIFVQGLAEGLGIKEKIISPTFVLVRQHKLPNHKGFFYHIDLYRLEGGESFNHIGLEDFISNPKNVVVIEWAEKLKELPKIATNILIQKQGTNKRVITLS